MNRRIFTKSMGLCAASLAMPAILQASGNKGKPDITKSSVNKFKMIYFNPPLILEPERVLDANGVIRLSDLPDPEPQHPLRLEHTTPLMERLWRIALSDIESNIVHTKSGNYFGAGARFGAIIYTRDISYSGVLGLNRLYPDMMRKTLEFTRKTRLQLGLKVSRGYAVNEIKTDWKQKNISEVFFLLKYLTNSYTRRTDDVVWLWCAGDLIEKDGTADDWKWIYETGKKCFEILYNPFYDQDDGLYRGQASFVDIPFKRIKATGYPRDWNISDCVLIKSTSTNCLYVKGLEVMSQASSRIGLKLESEHWASRANALKQAIRNELRRPDGTFAYFKDRHGNLQNRRDALGTALAVLMEVVSGDEAIAACRGYPVTDAGVPLFHPFFPKGNFYHNNSSWPFVDTFFIKALEKSDGVDRAPLNAALLARTCVKDGTFHEVCDFRKKKVRGSGSQLWTAASFVDTCRRAGLVKI